MQVLKDLKILRVLPRIKSAGATGEEPAPSDRTLSVSVQQIRSAENPRYTMVLNPLKPDNSRQTVYQKLSAPEVKLLVEQKVPDIILAEGPTLSKPQVDLSLSKPLAPQNSQDQKAEAAPTLAPNATPLPFKIAATVQQPQLPVSYFTANSLHAVARGNSQAGGPDGSSDASSGDPTGGLVVVSMDPAAFSKFSSLAQGNRYAGIVIAPGREGVEVVGGAPNGTPGSGSGGKGKGGEGGPGNGSGHAGGGGAGDGKGNGVLSAAGGIGGAGGIDTQRMLGAVRPSTVYAVPASFKLRRPPLVIATGPMGGGGLDLYGALPCGKVYTIFLPMPGKNWVLQYCAHQTAEQKPEQTNAGVVRLEAGLVPPSADQQFDFHRQAIPEKDADKLIVLRGLIGKDGSVSEVHVYQSVLPEMDANAALAFSSWKFKPAIRANLPTSVDVLVGIPARILEKQGEAPSGSASNQN
jgi:hypothetical protein